MGTRGLLGHVLRNGTKKGMYNHWDSYPGRPGLGNAIAKFIKSLSEEDLQKMAEQVEKLIWVKANAPPSAFLQSRYIAAGFANTDVSEQSTDEWFCLIYKMQGAVALPKILDGSLQHLIDNTDFADDGLFCEWAYWIDWNKREVIIENGVDAKISFEDLSEEWMNKLGREEEIEETDSDASQPRHDEDDQQDKVREPSVD